MCGIIGILSTTDPVHEPLASRMLHSLKHRGPDGQTLWFSENKKACLGHARLSIIDLETGWQPLHAPELGLSIVFNGEIYNYRELRKTLEAQGYSFQTQSDTEALLKAYHRYGVKVFDHLNGMYAFSIYHHADHSLFFARDPIGIKPFYYSHQNHRFCFASELRTVALALDHPPELNPAGFAEYLVQGYTLAPATVIRSIEQLPHGHYGHWKAGTLQTHRYYDLAERVVHSKNNDRSEPQVLETLDRLMKQVVQRQMIADVPVGTFLSAGVDSTLVTAYATKTHPDPIQSFVADFSNPEFSEAKISAQSAQALHTQHQALHTDENRLPLDWKKMAWACDAPIFDQSFLPTYSLCEGTRKHVKVVLSGDGGDEAHLGYETTRADWLNSKLSFLPSLTQSLLRTAASVIPTRFGKVPLSYKIKAFSRAFGQPAAQAHCAWREIFPKTLAQELLTPQAINTYQEHHPSKKYAEAASRVKNWSLLSRMSYLDFEMWLPNDILIKADRASMAHGLEIRVPLLDIEWVEFALSLPDDLKFHAGELKHLLKQLLHQRLPSYDTKAPKKGFSAPMNEWLCGPLRTELEEWLTREHVFDHWFKPGSLQQLAQEHWARKTDHSYILWALMVLDTWFDQLNLARASS